MRAPNGTTSPATGDGDHVSLPILADAESHHVQRDGRMGRRRAIVLGLVQLAIIAHVLIWWFSRQYGWFGGRTITPIEPSEGMEFAKYGVINAGLIFFAVALLSTLILGRWFCGWGCHIVMLQDFCLWIMRKFRIRPKPFRSRLLMWAPLILAIYMFIWPVFYRFVIAPFVQPDLQWPGISLHLTTTDFWATFPGLFVAIIFLGVCGFATVYFLGAKGFCTYGCPYGGFFAPLDKVAPMRIRVTDDCRGCGNCTAVCTSNVRVHEEVRTWGMVTDPGCMKTMDCVSNCPSDALYVGLGRPALGRKGVQRTERTARKWDLTIWQEIALAIVCLVLFWSFRGLYGSVPMLMAIGIAGVLTFIFWLGWRLVVEPNVNLHRWRLKFHGTIRAPGYVFAVLVLVLLAISIQAAVIQSATWNGDRLMARVDMPVAMALRPTRRPLGYEDQEVVDRAMSSYRLASGIHSGGIGFVDNPQVQLSLARLSLIEGDPRMALERYRKVREKVGPMQSVDLVMLEVMIRIEPEARRVDFIDETLREHPEWHEFRMRAITVSMVLDDPERVSALLEAGLAEHPDALGLLRIKAMLLLGEGNVDESIVAMQKYLTLAPTDPLAWATLARTLAMAGRQTEGDVAIQRALREAPESDLVRDEAVAYYVETGRSALADEIERGWTGQGR